MVNNAHDRERKMPVVRPKMPLPKVADLAVLREVVKKAQEARSLRRYADEHIQEARSKISKRVADTLWRRYQTYLKREAIGDLTFFEWLDGRLLHNTYLFHSFETRLYWVFSVIQSTKISDMALFGEPEFESGQWYFEMMEELINRRQTVEGFRLLVREELVEHPRYSDWVPSIRFRIEHD